MVVVVPPGWWWSPVCVIPIQDYFVPHVLLCEWGVPLFFLDVTSLLLTPPPAGKPQLAPPSTVGLPSYLFFYYPRPCAYF